MASRLSIEPQGRPEPGQILIVIRTWINNPWAECDAFGNMPYGWNVSVNCKQRRKLADIYQLQTTSQLEAQTS